MRQSATSYWRGFSSDAHERLLVAVEGLVNYTIDMTGHVIDLAHATEALADMTGSDAIARGGGITLEE